MKKGLYFIISVLVSASVYAGDPPNTFFIYSM